MSRIQADTLKPRPVPRELDTYPQEAGWPDVRLVLAVETQVSWPAHLTPPAALSRFVRTHWHIENRLHWPREAILGPGAC